jgi:hypothetical protein
MLAANTSPMAARNSASSRVTLSTGGSCLTERRERANDEE